MTINDISKELGLTKRAIKFYEEKGLLFVPKDENGYRNYSQEHIRILKTISVYRKLGIGITDIQKIINHGDESILLQVLKAKEAELQDKQAELLELQTFISTHDVDQAYEQLEYETVAQAIRDAVPGFYGRYFLNHFQPYLQIKIQTKEQEDAYNTIKEFWDNTEIRIPITTHKRVDTHKHGIQLMHSIDAIKSSIGMAQNKVKTILERLFRKGGNPTRKLIALETAEFYAFVINNQHKLKEEFRAVTAQMAVQMTMTLQPKKSPFRIPEQDFFKYDPGVKNEVEYLSNAYHEYTSGFATSVVRSTCEMLFEQHCEGRDDIEWVYKNGDTGQQYFSIVYIDGIQKQWLFYADYIVMKKDGTIWIIETKGGETKGKNKNIDDQIENKFNAFKAYAADKELCWGFVRDKDNQLYINNTEFMMDMADEHWVPLTQIF